MEEIWKLHPRINEDYEFSNHGNFRKVSTKFEFKKTVDTTRENSGYVAFLKIRDAAERKRFKIHRIIAEIFIPNDDVENKIIVKHIDGDRCNNHVSNLMWVTEEESVAIDMVRTTREFGKFSPEEVIQLREEFEATEINIFDLAAKANVAPTTLTSLLRYKTYSTVQPEKRHTYSINILVGEQYDEFFALKLSEKTAIVSLKKTKQYRKEYKAKNKKPSKKAISVFYISKEDFQPIYDDYINSGLENYKLFEKHNIKIGHLNHNKVLYEAPQVILLEGEEFIPFNQKTFISNKGRFLSEDKTRIIQYKVQTESVAKAIARKIVTRFLGLKPQQLFEFIDGNPYNFNVENLKAKQRFQTIPNEIIEKIKYDYINTRITQMELTEKYGFTITNINRQLKGLKKKRICYVCGTDDPEDFLCYNNRKRCDECEDNNPKAYKNLTDEERTAKIKMASDWVKENPLRTKLLGARARARSKGIDFELDEEFITNLYNEQDGKCFYSGLPISIDFSEEINVFSIDRIDSKFGYLKDNVCLTNKHINTMKLNMTLGEFFGFIKAIYEFSNIKLMVEPTTEPKAEVVEN